MRRRSLLPLLAWPALAQEQPSQPGKAGFAEGDITPAIGQEIPGNYFKQYHRSVHDASKVRVAYLEFGGQAVALVGMDALVVPRELVLRVRAQFPNVEVLIGASHSHSSGPVGMVQPGEYDHADPAVQDLAYKVRSAADAGFLAHVEAEITKSITAARKNANESLWGYGQGEEGAAVFNRRFRMRNGRTYTHPQVGNPDIITAAGPIDPKVTVLGVFNPSRQLVGCIVNYSCHATTNPGGASANWIHYLERTIRGTFGPGVTVVFLQGYSGDVTQVDNLDPLRQRSGEESAQLVGGRVGAEAVKVLLSMRPSAPSPISVRRKTYPQGRRLPSAARVERAKAIVAASNPGARTADVVFARETLMLAATAAKRRAVEMEVQAIAIGPMAYVASPGEIFVELGLAVRRGSPFLYTNPVSLANGSVGYIPTPEAFSDNGGGYEQRLSAYTNLVPDAGPRLVREAVALLRQLQPVAPAALPAAPPYQAPWDYGSVAPENDAITPRTTIELFNGKTLDGWRIWLRGSGTQDPLGVFRVVDGVLRISGEDWGGLNSLGEYRDYRLVVEWKWGEKTWGNRADRARDSGILIHAHGPDNGYSNTWPESIESQIIEGGAGDILVVTAGTPMSASCRCRMEGKEMVWDPKGEVMTRTSGRIDWFARSPEWRDELGFRRPTDLEKPRGEWNIQEVIAAGDAVLNRINGKLASAAFDLSHTQGHLVIQSEGAEIFVRRITLHPLSEADRRLARQQRP